MAHSLLGDAMVLCSTAWLFVTSALLLSCRVTVRPTLRAHFRRVPDSAAQVALLRFNPPRWVPWTAASAMAVAQADAKHTSRKATRWLGELTPETRRMLYLAPLIHYSAGGGVVGALCVVTATCWEGEGEDLLAADKCAC